MPIGTPTTKGESLAQLRSGPGKSFRRDAGDDDLVQPEAGGFTQPGDAANPTGGETISAGDHHDDLPGIGAGLSIIFTKPDSALARRGARYLPRAGNSLRKLHTSAHDFIGLTIRGFGCAADADDLQPGTGYLRVRRPHHANRHCKEERDHDDRLCAR